VSDANFLHPALEAARPPGRLPHITVAPRIRRRCFVAGALIAADLGAGFAVIQTVGMLTGTGFTVEAWMIPALIAIYWTLGLYNGFGPSPYERLGVRVQGIGLLIIAYCALGILAGRMPHAGFIALACPGLFMAGHYSEACVRSFLIRRQLWGGTAVFVGAGKRSGLLARHLQRYPEFGLRPAGFVHVTQDDTDPMPRFLPALGGVADLENMASWVEVLIFRSAADTAALSPSLWRRLDARHLVVVGESDELPSLWLKTRSLGGLIGVELRQHAKKWNRRFRNKRLVDLLLAVPACLLVAPIIALAALAIKAVDPGPAFYFQDRVGINGRNFRVCKLRTMYQDAESRLEEHLAKDPTARAEWQRFLSHDPRILPIVGTFLRRTSLDELPQLRNVVLGQMSLVGPRPFPSYHVRSFDREFQDIRCSIPPGLSGLWQVAGRSNGSLEVQRQQDLFYILNWSIWLDMYILIETPLAIITARGAK
jgi:lipopolysaccharide/colanic/teichoic acid biosynthesis glycosyltransferase